MYDDTHPSKITIDFSGKDIPEHFLTFGGGTIGFMQYVKLATIKCNSIPIKGLVNLFNITPDTLKIKVKANGTIGRSFIGNTGAYTKIWIPNTVTGMSWDEYDGGPFLSSNSSVLLYCEPTSQPSGWNMNWNVYNINGASLDANWGVTEAAFDAM